MGHIKEPKGVDFIINSRPLTKKEEAAISEYVKAYKMAHAAKKSTTRNTAKKKAVRKRNIV